MVEHDYWRELQRLSSRCSLLRPTFHAQNARAPTTASAASTAEASAGASPPTAEAPHPLQLSARVNKIRISTSKTNVAEYVIDKIYFSKIWVSESNFGSRAVIRQRIKRRRARARHTCLWNSFLATCRCFAKRNIHTPSETSFGKSSKYRRWKAR